MKQLYKFLLFILVVAAPVAGVAQSKSQPDSGYSAIIPIVAEACESFSWDQNDSLYTQSCQDTVGNDSDTAFVLRLTVYYADTTDVYITVCNEYVWNDTIPPYYVSGDYTQYFKTVHGCDSVVRLHLTINPLPEVTIATTSDTFCESGVIWVSNVNPSYEYQWNDSTTNTWMSVDSSGTYYVTVTDTNQCSKSESIAIVVNQPYLTQIDSAICQGENVDFYGQTLTETGVYTQTLQTVNGCDSVITLTLIVNPSPTPVIYGDNEICYGETTTLTAIGGSNCSYLWSNSSTINSINVSESGSYTVTVTNEYSCSATAAFDMTVDTLPNVSINAVSPICSLQTATLTATGASTYTWNNGLGIGNDKQVSPTETTNYSVTGTDGNGCSNTTQVTVTVNQLPNVSVNPVMPICSLHNSTLTATEATNYIWSTGDSVATISVSPSATTTYSVTGTDDNGCQNTADVTVVVNPLPIVTINGVNPICIGQNAMLTAMGGSTYTWDHGLGTGNNKQVSPSVSTTYSVTGTDGNGCQNTAEVTVTVNQLPIVTISGNSSFCEGSGTILTASGANTYAWSNGATDSTTIVNNAGDYTVTGTDANGCNNTAVLTVNVVHTVTSTISYFSCETYTWNDSIYTTSGDYIQTFSASNGCDSVVTLHLTINNAVHTDLFVTECGSHHWNDTEYTESGNYTQTFTATNGCDSTVTLYLIILPTIQDVDSIVSKRHKDGNPYMLIYPDTGFLYQWFKNDILQVGETKQYYVPGGTLTDDTCYQVRITPIGSSNNCGVKTPCWKDKPSPSSELRILPNPNDGQFRLLLPEGTVNVHILNANGQVVMARKVDGDELLEMNIGLANGLYFVKTFLEDGSFNTEKLIINR